MTQKGPTSLVDHIENPFSIAELKSKFSLLADRIEKYEGLIISISILAISSYMYIVADSFRPRAALFPQLAAGIAIIGSIYLTVRELLKVPFEPKNSTQGKGATGEVNNISEEHPF